MSCIYRTCIDPNVVKIASDDSHRLAIVRDIFCEGPREWDNLGRMVCWHRGYNLGDITHSSDYQPDDWRRDIAMEVDDTVENRIDYWEAGRGWSFLDNKYSREAAIRKCDEIVSNIVDEAIEKNVLMLSLGLLDHSGLHIWVGSGSHWSDPGGWDSGQVGWIYITKQEIKEKMCRPKPLKKGQINPDLEPIKHVTQKDWERAEKVLCQEVETYDMYLRGCVYGFVVETVDGEHVDSCYGFYGVDPEVNGMKEHIPVEACGLIESLEWAR